VKTLKLSDQTHAKLTAVVGQLTAQTGKNQTYEESIQILLQRIASLPPELLLEIEDFMDKNKQFGYSTKEDFLKDATRFRIDYLRRQKQIQDGKSSNDQKPPT